MCTFRHIDFKRHPNIFAFRICLAASVQILSKRHVSAHHFGLLLRHVYIALTPDILFYHRQGWKSTNEVRFADKLKRRSVTGLLIGARLPSQTKYNCGSCCMFP